MRSCSNCGGPVLSRDKRVRSCSRACGNSTGHRRRSRPPAIDRFWSKVNVDGPGNCWIWTGAIDKDGYGKFFRRGRGRAPDRAHRYSYVLHHGAIPDGMDVLHDCDRRRCVNPDHLRAGTNADNMADRDAKGRQVKGSRVWNSMLTDEKVREIRRIHPHPRPRYCDTAKRFGVSAAAVRDVATRKTWRHVR